jgi:5-methyltetrahydrofolate--homocysteine methyltransferase
VERFAGGAQVAFTEIGGNLDIAASLRDTMTLLMDCADDPEAVDGLCRHLTPLWLRYYNELEAVIGPAGRGTSAWAPFWSPGRGCILVNDFAYMIGPEQFERWSAPYLEACCAELDHCIYHLDGKGQIGHLDQLLAMPGLKGVQWIPGDGQPEAADPMWWPLLKRIRDAGKLTQIYSSGEGVLRMAREVPLTGFAIETWARNGEQQADLIEAIQRENAAVTGRATVAVA